MINKKRMTQNVLLVAVAVITLAIVITSNHFENRIHNQKLLYYQLQAIRTSVNLFKAINKRNPHSLNELAVAEYQFPGDDHARRFIEILDADHTGTPLDPFGHQYIYEFDSGWVRSSTPGYEYW